MLTINPIKFNNNKKYISFGEGNLNNITPEVGAMALQLKDPSANIQFRENLRRTQKADAVQANPLTAIAYKLIKTYNILSPSNNKPNNNNTHNVSFMA